MARQTANSTCIKNKLFSEKNKKYMKELKQIFDWVEEITVKLEFKILTEEQLKQMDDMQYKNKWKKYLFLKKTAEKFIQELMDVPNEMNILDKFTRFRYFIDNCQY